MTRRPRQRLAAAVRLIICTVALAWVLKHVTFYDYVALDDGSRLRVVSMDAEYMTVRAADGSLDRIPCGPGGCPESGGVRVEYGLNTTWDKADKPRLLLCLALFAPVTLIQSKRFQFMLRAQDIQITWFESAKLCYAGNFLNFIAGLGSTGGDVFKAYYVSLHTERKTEAVTTVILDRVAGLTGLLIIASSVLVFRIGDPKLTIIVYPLFGIVGAGVAGAFLFFSRPVRKWIRPERWFVRLPFFGQIQRAESAVRRLAERKGLFFASLGLSLALQVIAITSCVYAAMAIGMRSEASAVFDYFAYLAGGMVVAAVPISFQGLGTMEAFFTHVMLDSHGSLPAILCLSMTIRLIGLFWALPGVIVTMTGAYRPGISKDEIRFA